MLSLSTNVAAVNVLSTYVTKVQLTSTSRQFLYSTKETPHMLTINMAAEQDVMNCACAEGLNISQYLVSEYWSRFAVCGSCFYSCLYKEVDLLWNVSYLLGTMREACMPHFMLVKDRRIWVLCKCVLGKALLLWKLCFKLTVTIPGHCSL